MNSDNSLINRNKKGVKIDLNSFFILSRGEKIRTSDHTPPRRVL